MMNPEAFEGVGFVFTSGSASVGDRDEAATVIIARDRYRSVSLLSASTKRALRNWPVCDIFSDWSEEDVSAWPLRFICAHRGSRGRISYWFYERSHSVILGDQRGIVFAEQKGGMGKALGFPFGRNTMAQTDARKLSLIFSRLEGEGHALFANSDRFAAFLAELEMNA